VRQRLGKKVNVFSIDCGLLSDEFGRRELVDEEAKDIVHRNDRRSYRAHVTVE
jgi:hypothetical protein